MNAAGVSRRAIVAASAAAPLIGLSASVTGRAEASSGLPYTVAARSPWMVNQVAVTPDNVIFLGLPRYPDHEVTPSIARIQANGAAVPFPGDAWNDWKPGDDGLNAFVYVNSLRVLNDGCIWCVDQGTLRPDASPRDVRPPKPGAQKVVRLDPRSGTVREVIRFPPEVLPPGGQLNDLRMDGHHLYLTDSGLGGIIVHDRASGRSVRRLSGAAQVGALPVAASGTGAPVRHRVPKSDMIELSPDGRWLYWSAPTGPFWRVETRLLRDEAINDETLAAHIQHVADIDLSGGSAMDSLGNLYLSEIKAKRIVILSPTGAKAVIAENAAFDGPDNPFIGADRQLYVPMSQAGRTRLFGNSEDLTRQPFLVISVALPRVLDGISLGDQIR